MKTSLGTPRQRLAINPQYVFPEERRRIAEEDRNKKIEASRAAEEKDKQRDDREDENLRRRLLADDPTALTPKEQIFADRILAGDTQRAAYLMANPTRRSDGVADAGARALMRRNKVITYIQRESRAAAERVVELSKTATSESVRLDANQDILDRAGVAPPVAPQVAVTINIAQVLAALGVK